jgi:hypothetical protein
MEKTMETPDRHMAAMVTGSRLARSFSSLSSEPENQNV